MSSKSYSFRDKFRLGVNASFGVLGIILLVLLIFNISRSLVNGGIPTNLTFTGLLNFVSSTGGNYFNTSFVDLTIRGSWGVLQPLKEFLNIVLSVFNLLVFFAKNLVGVLRFLLGFVKFMFAV